MKNVSNERCRENLNKHFMFNEVFFENRVFYEIRSKNTVKPDRPRIILMSMRIACWKSKATNTHTGCVILITFPIQQWLHERASLLRYT